MNAPTTTLRPFARTRGVMPPAAPPVRPVRAARVARLAAFRSPETYRLGREIGIPVAVLRVVDDPADHVRILSETWHACWRASDDGWFMPFDYGYAWPASARFEQVPLDARWMGTAALPASMAFADGCVDVELAPGVGRSDLAQAFGQAMAPHRFDEVAQQPARVRKRFAGGRRLEVASRYAAPPAAGCDGRVRLVDDLYHFRPRALPLVVGALEASSRILSMCSALAVAAAPAG